MLYGAHTATTFISPKKCYIWHMLPSRLMEKAAREAVTASQMGVRRFEAEHGLRKWSLRGLLDKTKPKVPSVDNAAEICNALDLEFYIGPRREPSPSSPVSEPWWEPCRGLLGPACPVVLARRFRAAFLGAMDKHAELEITSVPDPSCPHPMLCINGCRHMANAAREKERIEMNHGVFTTPVPMPEGETSAIVSPHGCAWFGSGMLAEIDLDPERCKAVEIRDDAMAPTLPARSVTLIDERKTELRPGGVYALETPGGIVVRRATIAENQWLAFADCSAWDPIRWPERGEAAIIGEAIWRAKYVPVGPAPDSNGLTSEPTPTPSDKPAYNVVDVDTSDASVEAVPFRGRLVRHQPRDFDMQIAAWFGTKFIISDLQIEPAEAEVTVPVDDTMAPSLWPNSAVLVDRRRVELEDGAIYEIETSDGLMFRRAMRHGKEWVLETNDPNITPRPWVKSDEVVGRAVWTGGFMPRAVASAFQV